MNEMFDFAFANTRVMGIFRGKSPEDTVRLCHAAWDAGVVAVEVPVQNDEAFEALAAAAAERGEGQLIGAGTVRTPDQLRRAVDAGAQFTVAPGTDTDIIALSIELGVPHLPGVATSTDIHRALLAGAQWVKAFPAAELGASWITAQLAPVPEAKFVATGGMGPGNAAEFLAAGARGIAIGSAFEDPELLAAMRAAGLLG
jgi:2-dehydro-3-deoxyphosphogluconate aldolase/(4S)-4-hydroxy-2-oxoglutarate aldolase